MEINNSNDTRKKTHYIFLITIFMCIIFLSFILSFISKITGYKCDVSLNGYTEQFEEVQFSVSNFFDGSFQKSCENIINNNIKPRAIYTKTYNTIKLDLFNESERIIGKNNDIFEINYINGELALGNEYNYSTEEKQKEMENFVNILDSVQNKLNRYNKSLYVYITPNKANVDKENIPDKYVSMSATDSVNQVESFQKYIDKTSIPYFMARDMLENLEYPAFYTTGIHWSRTYEQKSSQKIINDLKAITGKNYRNISIDSVENSNIPYWRDADVYDLLNVWDKYNLTYYQYNLSESIMDNYDRMRILLYGDSFGQGLRKDVLETLSGEQIYYINYNNYVVDSKENSVEIHQNFENVDWQNLLDISDVIVIQMAECHIKDYTLGFVQYLNEYLDYYIPQSDSDIYPANFDATNGISDDRFIQGVYGIENDFAWIDKYCNFDVCDEKISENGLVVKYYIPEQIIDMYGQQRIDVYINGKLIEQKEYNKSMYEEMVIESDRVPKSESSHYFVEIKCSNFFNPGVTMGTDDYRNLSLRVVYVGGKK